MKTDFEITLEMAEWKERFGGITLDEPTWQKLVCAGMLRWNQAVKYNEVNDLHDNIKEVFRVA